MDPTATLIRFLDACRAGERDEATEALKDLTDWIGKGGFLPFDPRPTTEPEPPATPLSELLTEYVLFTASGVAPGEPFTINVEDAGECLCEGEDEPPGQDAILAALPATLAHIRQKSPEARYIVQENGRGPAQVIWAGL